MINNLTKEQAGVTRDTISKLLFKKMFAWIVDKINVSISNGYDTKKAKGSNFTGILDIFGFEIFDTNSFE